MTRILVLAIAGFGIGFVGPSTARADHYDIYLIAGQSNCDGRGAVADLKGRLANWADPQPDVKIAYSCSKLRGPVLSTGGFVPLQPGYSVAPGKRPKALPSGTFGPEVAFGRGIADGLPKRKVALVKYAEGGTSLARNWNPDAKDGLYAAFVTFTRDSLAELKKQGHTATIRGMIWHQGESDAKLSAEEYQRRLTGFIAAVREEFDIPKLPFGIGAVIDNGQRDSILAAQKATADTVPGAFLVEVNGLTSHDRGTHFDAKSQLMLGQRFADGMIRALADGPTPPDRD